MSITEKVRELIAHAHEHGYASELPESVQTVLHAIAEHVQALGGSAPADISGQIEELVKAQVEKLVPDGDKVLAAVDERAKQVLADLDASIEQRVEKRFQELLAKAAAQPAANLQAGAANVQSETASSAAAGSDASAGAAAAV